MMATYCFFLIILCAGEAFSLDCTLLQHERQRRGFSTFLQPEGQCCKCSAFLQPEKQYRGFKALHGYAITFNGSSALDQIAVPTARELNTRSNANKTTTMDGIDSTMFIGITLGAVTSVALALCWFTITKLRSFQHLHDEPCPQLYNSREESVSEVLGRGSVSPCPRSSTMQKDYGLSGRKGYVETPADSEESSNANVRVKCKTTQYSFQDPPLMPEKKPTNQNGNFDEISNSQILDDIRELKERMACKICLGRDMCVVFLPCNHMVTCENCSVMLHRCAVCRTVIKGTFTVYTQF